MGGVLTECNHFGGPDIDIAAFERYELRYGEQIFEIDAGAVGGMLSVCRERNAEVVPLLFASTCPGGLVTTECYTQLKDDLLGRLAESLPVDGVLLPLHGAMAAQEVPDCDGDLIESVRQLVGPNVPIVATLDLHAQVTREMVEFADALVAWETYPHRDAETTGRRGAELLLNALAVIADPSWPWQRFPS